MVRLKTIFLVAITSARRVSELGALSCRSNLCVFHRDKVVLHLEPSFRPKVAFKFHYASEIVLPSFCPRPSHPKEREWHTLDVKRALKFYLARTADIRTTDSLFVNISPPRQGNRMSTSAISACLRTCIKEAYCALKLTPPSGIVAHSTRSAATSTAFANRASSEEICRAATWSSPSTFIRHYKIDVFDLADAAFGRRILQCVVNLDGESPPGC